MNVFRIMIFFMYLSIVLANTMWADVKLASIFGSNMVLQQEKPIKIWGSADSDEKINITLGNECKYTQADESGKWSVIFPPRKASFNPVTIIAEGTNTIKFDNVLVGEVWFCGGQSNMYFQLKRVNDAERECNSANYPYIRFCQVDFNIGVIPQNDFRAKWVLCSPKTASEFSAVGYFFGKDIYKKLNVPVGLVSSNYGGTSVEAWTPLEYLETVESMQERVKADKPLLNPDVAEMARRQNAKNWERYNASFAQAVKNAENPESESKYSAVDFDDAVWKDMKLPTEFGGTELKNYTGCVWFRRAVNIPADWSGKDLVLNMGPVDEIDSTWFNGVKIGQTGSLKPLVANLGNISRQYAVPGRLVKAGRNIIAVRMANTFHRGGFYGKPAAAMFLNIKSDSNAEPKIPLAGNWKYLPAVPFPKKPTNPIHANLCSVLYNGMINPMVGFAVRGVIWYQGEYNAGRSYQYRQLMPLMIKAWREKWKDPTMVFIQTQLAGYTAKAKQPSASPWAELREAQLMTAQNDPLCGMAVTIDVGDAADIHPRNKQDVGARLALQAYKLAYGQNIPFEGPIYKSMKVEGDKIRLSFTSVFGGLATKGMKLEGFAIAGKDKKFVWAQAKVDGDDVIVWSDEIATPTSVRYGWANNPECNLYNVAGLPATPFRTDAWKGITADKK